MPQNGKNPAKQNTKLYLVITPGFQSKKHLISTQLEAKVPSESKETTSDKLTGTKLDSLHKDFHRYQALILMISFHPLSDSLSSDSQLLQHVATTSNYDTSMLKMHTSTKFLTMTYICINLKDLSNKGKSIQFVNSTRIWPTSIRKSLASDTQRRRTCENRLQIW